MIRVHPLAIRGTAAATTFFLGVLLAWSITTPAFRGPDEPAHVSSVSRVARERSWPPPQRARMDDAVRRAYHATGFVASPWAENPPLGHVGPGQGPASPSMHDLRGSDLRRAPGTLDPSAVHPPGYYAMLAVPYSLLGLDDAAPTGAVLSLRLLSLLLLIPIPWLCASAATSLGLRPQAVVVSAFVPVAWIQFVHIGATVTNGSLTVATTAAVTALLIPVVRQGDLSRSRAVVVGLLTAIGLLSKGFAFALPCMVVIAYVAAIRRAARAQRFAAWPWALAASAPGIAWWVFKLTRLDTLQPRAAARGPAGNVYPDVLTKYVPRALLDLSSSLWVNLGWLNTPPPLLLHLAATAVALGLLIAGTRRWWGERSLLMVLHASWAVPLSMIVLWSLEFYMKNGFVDGMQGRYLQTGVVAGATVAVAPLEHFPRFLRFIPLAAVALALGGLMLGMRSFWQPADPRTILGWWPGGNAVAFVSAMLLLVGASATAIDCLRSSVQAPARPRTDVATSGPAQTPNEV